MTNLQHLRETIGSHLGRVLTPEAAAEIEAAIFWRPDESHNPAKFGVAEYKGYTIQAERLSEVLPELKPLHAAHWMETERHRHGLELDPDYDSMLADERAGRLLQFTARKDGRVAAHLRIYIATSRHTRTVFSQEDTLYLDPTHRPGAFLVMQLLRFAEQALVSLGVFEIRADSKLVNNAGVLMRRLGYTAVATQFVKIIKEHSDVQ